MTAILERIRSSLVGLRMPCALEALDHTLLTEEYATRENRRIAVALKTARLTPPKTLESFDFAFQPSLDRNRILALAQLRPPGEWPISWAMTFPSNPRRLTLGWPKTGSGSRSSIVIRY